MKSINLVYLLTVVSGLFFNFNIHAEEEISGAEVINNNCARCHNARSLNEFSIPEWSVIMPHMREKAHLTGQETEAVMQFITTVLEPTNGNINSSKPNIKVEDGEALYKKFGCQGCHSLNRVGGKVGPELDKVIDAKGEAFFKQKLLNPQFNNSTSPMPRMPLNEEQIKSIARYIKNN